LPKTPLIEYASLAELYDAYCELFVAKSPIVSACGCQIHCREHHFVHVVKLFGEGRRPLHFPDEKAKIVAQTEGFGDYIHEARRAQRLLRFEKALREPDAVVRPAHLKTADRAWMRHVDCSQYPFMAALAQKEQGVLTLCSLQPLRARNMSKWMDGPILYPVVEDETAEATKAHQPPEGG